MTEISREQPLGICFVSPKAYPLFNPDCKGVFGGAEVDLYLLSTELAKDQNFHVTFITADYGQPAEEISENVTIIRSLDFKRNALEGALRIWRALKKTDADLYMLETVSPGVPLAVCFCRLYGRAFVYRTASVLECNGQYVKEHGVPGRIFNWSLRRARAVVVQNKSDQENLLSTTGIKSLVIPNGHRFSELSSADRESILWVGRSDRIKGPMRFVELARNFPSERFVMICQKATGDTNYDHLRDLAAKRPNLQFISHVPFDRIDAYFLNAKILVNTSVSEGFPNTFIQAGKCATAILSLNVNPDGFLTRYSCGVVCDGSEQRLDDGLRSLLGHDRYVEIGQNGRRYAKEHHDISKIVAQYKEIFTELSQKVHRRCRR